VVTGLGTVGAYGSGAESLRRALASSAPPALSEVDRSAGYHLAQAPRRAYLVDPALLREWVPPGEARRMSPPSRFAVATARMAFRCAGFGEGLPDEGTGVVISTAFGPASYSERLLKQILLEGPESASPILFMESVANAPAAQIAIAPAPGGRASPSASGRPERSWPWGRPRPTWLPAGCRALSPEAWTR